MDVFFLLNIFVNKIEFTESFKHREDDRLYIRVSGMPAPGLRNSTTGVKAIADPVKEIKPDYSSRYFQERQTIQESVVS